MSSSPYNQLDKFIDEYVQDSKNFHPNKLIMINYPKVFVMIVVSTFERQIKQCCQNFLDFPLVSIASYHNLVSLIQECNTKNRPIVEGIYGRFYTMNPVTQIVNLSATRFYDLFGGQAFRTQVSGIFTNELADRIAYYRKMVDKLLPLLDINDQYDDDYVKNDDILLRLQSCTFAMAEDAFLNLKLRRNAVAHDYISGMSDSFENIRDFYLNAVVYVTAIEKAIMGMTDVVAMTPAL